MTDHNDSLEGIKTETITPEELAEAAAYQKLKDAYLSEGDRPTIDDKTGFQPIGKVDRYKIVKELGAGNFGRVYLALDTVSETLVALKALPPNISAIPEELEKVRKNFSLVSKIHHPNIASLLFLHKVEHADEAARKLLKISDRTYLQVMEYVKGTTLFSWMNAYQDHVIPLERILKICYQVAQALDYAHSQGVIHRDVKPSNIMIGDNDVVKVMDFGLAAEIRSSMSRVSKMNHNSAGTRPYMAPEHLAGKTQSAATDQYALAVLFYEMVNKKVPFHSIFMREDDIPLILDVVRTGKAERLPQLSRKQNSALLRALSKKPGERFASCGQFIDALSGKTVYERKGLVRKIAIAAGIFVMLILGWHVLKTSEPVKPPPPPPDDDGDGVEVVVDSVKIEEVSPVRLNAEVVWEKVKKIDKSGGFEKDLDRLDLCLRESQVLFDKHKYGDALKQYTSFIKGCNDLMKLDKECNYARNAAEECANAKRDAERNNAATDARTLYLNAGRLSHEAHQTMLIRKYARATKQYHGAKQVYEQASVYAKGYQSVVPLKKRFERQLKTISSVVLNNHGGTVWLRVNRAACKGNTALGRGEWAAASHNYEEALQYLPQAIETAKAGALLQEKQDNANAAYKQLMLSANTLYKESRQLSSKDFKAYEKCSTVIKLISGFTGSVHYRYLSSVAKRQLLDLQSEAETHIQTLTPNIPDDLIVVTDAKYSTLDGLAAGSFEAQERQKQWTRKLGLPLEVKAKKSGIAMRLIPPGTFIMGSPSTEDKRDSDEFLHSVNLDKPFYCSKFEISQEQWLKVMGVNPSHFKRNNQRPVEQVSLIDCMEFVRKLCKLEGVPEGTYRLISEAQWEYACRAGTLSATHFQKGVDESKANINTYYLNAEHGAEQTVSCGKFNPNAFGLYDMYGNVYEICYSKYQPYDRNKRMKKGDEVYYVIRGGSYANGPKMCRSAHRSRLKRDERDQEVGFRIIRIAK